MKPESQDIRKAIKYDDLKERYGLLPPLALREVVRVLTLGALKYSDDNWRGLDNLQDRYFDACMRHMWAHKEGQACDTETGRSHLAHALCCVMFMLEDQLIKTQ